MNGALVRGKAEFVPGQGSGTPPPLAGTGWSRGHHQSTFPPSLRGAGPGAPRHPSEAFSPSRRERARARQQPQAAGQRLRPGCAGNSPRFPQRPPRRGRGLCPSPHGPRGRTEGRSGGRAEGDGAASPARAYLRAPQGRAWGAPEPPPGPGPGPGPVPPQGSGAGGGGGPRP